MEATTEKLDGMTLAANKWMNAINSILMNAYNKQLDIAFGFYDNFSNPFSEANQNGWMPNFNKPFNANMASVFDPFNLFKSNNSFYTAKYSYEDLQKQGIDAVNIWTSSLQKQVKNAHTKWNELNEKTQEVFEEEWEVNRNLINAATEAYNKQIDFSTEANRKFMQELNNQFNLAAKRSGKFWSDALKTNSSADNSEKTDGHAPVKKHDHTDYVSAHNHHSHKSKLS